MLSQFVCWTSYQISNNIPGSFIWVWILLHAKLPAGDVNTEPKQTSRWRGNFSKHHQHKVQSYLIFVAGTAGGAREEKICTWQMWRNIKFLHMWINFTFLHMTDVETSEISFIMCTIYGILLHFTLFWCRICLFLRFTLFCRKIGLLRFTRYCVEKILAKNSARGEKMTIIRYGSASKPVRNLCKRCFCLIWVCHC